MALNKLSDDIYLEIQRGEGPFATPISGPIQVGEKISLVVRAKNPHLGEYLVAEEDRWLCIISEYNEKYHELFIQKFRELSKWFVNLLVIS